MGSLGESYEIIFVNDGSRDNTRQVLTGLAQIASHVKLIGFSRNFGHQAAITAGMEQAGGEAIIVIDANLQDPPEVIPQMVERWKQGFHVVYGKRIRRKGETMFKKFTAKLFYRLLRFLTDIEIPVDAGDFRLIDRKVNDALKRLPEKNHYVRGLISWLGFKQTAAEFVREERLAGETKYSLSKMLKFAVDGITGFSSKPLRLATVSGLLLSGVSFCYLLYVFYLKLFTDRTVLGGASLMAVNLFFYGFILIILGIFGEYIGYTTKPRADRCMLWMNTLALQSPITGTLTKKLKAVIDKNAAQFFRFTFLKQRTNSPSLSNNWQHDSSYRPLPRFRTEAYFPAVILDYCVGDRKP